ncbi:methyltransferase domain-containing protein [Streptomyces sp. NBC_01244]|uniref:methyltransferase domain-containing protein n=1 Tax=Streptomyces sp. NBC_01244 TaxID=2903797 RepID=UPI002E0F42D2|nr:methyltransferase domain-containing protein [Streptomyces sp. NBC_01244]
MDDMDSGEARGDQYDDESEDYVAYWQGRDYEHAAEIAAVKRLIGGRRYGLVCEVGGGFGRLSPLLKEYADRVMMFDPSAKHVAIAGRLLADRPGITAHHMRPGHLPLDDGSADLLSMIRVMHHLPDPGPTLREMARVLKPGGRALIEVANSAHMLNKLRYAKRLRGVPRGPVDIRSAEKVAEGSIPFVNHHPDTVVRQFADAGLRVEDKLSVSNMRSGRLKRSLGEDRLLAVEQRVQSPLAALNFGPSLFFLLRRSG